MLIEWRVGKGLPGSMGPETNLGSVPVYYAPW